MKRDHDDLDDVIDIDTVNTTIIKQRKPTDYCTTTDKIMVIINVIWSQLVIKLKERTIKFNPVYNDKQFGTSEECYEAFRKYENQNGNAVKAFWTSDQCYEAQEAWLKRVTEK